MTAEASQTKTPPLPCALVPPDHVLVDPVLKVAFEEDLGRAGDVTSEAVIGPDVLAKASAQARLDGRVAGSGVAARAFQWLDPSLKISIVQPDGSDVQRGNPILQVEGAARSILTAERVALNLLGHLSGIATLTNAFVRAIAGTKARIVCTRKTTPGLRALEKYAIRAGGGINHRFALDDAVMIKDNHIAIAGSISRAVAAARGRAGHVMRIEVEVDRLDQIDEALSAGADIILLDNMTPEQLGEAVTLIGGRAITEASGGVALETVHAIAQSGVDVISVGALTHSAPALDVGLDII